MRHRLFCLHKHDRQNETKSTPLQRALHKEALAQANDQRQELASQHSEQMLILLRQNTELTELTQQLSQRIEELTRDIHNKMLQQNSMS